MQPQRRHPPAPHRLNPAVIAVALLVALVVGGGIAAILAAGNHEQTPTVTRISAGAERQLASFGGTVENATIAVSPPSDWSVAAKSAISIDLEPPDHAGLNGYFSASFSGTLLQFAQYVANQVAKETTNAHICSKPARARVPNGPAGIVFGICATLVPQNGQATPIFDLLGVGVGHGAATEVRFISPARVAQLRRLVSESRPVLSTVRWKLLG